MINILDYIIFFNKKMKVNLITLELYYYLCQPKKKLNLKIKAYLCKIIFEY